MGGGALPQVSLPSRALALTVPPLTPPQLEARLRQAQPPIIARIEQDTLLLDMRTLLPDDLPALKAALQGVLPASNILVPKLNLGTRKTFRIFLT